MIIINGIFKLYIFGNTMKIIKTTTNEVITSFVFPTYIANDIGLHISNTGNFKIIVATTTTLLDTGVETGIAPYMIKMDSTTGRLGLYDSTPSTSTPYIENYMFWRCTLGDKIIMSSNDSAYYIRMIKNTKYKYGKFDNYKFEFHTGNGAVSDDCYLKITNSNNATVWRTNRIPFINDSNFTTFDIIIYSDSNMGITAWHTNGIAYLAWYTASNATTSVTSRGCGRETWAQYYVRSYPEMTYTKSTTQPSSTSTEIYRAGTTHGPYSLCYTDNSGFKLQIN
jgi:hypothetical protein